MKILILVVLLCTTYIHPFSAWAEKFPGIEVLMTQDEYKKSGLEKLSKSEIESINQWLIQYTAGDAKYLRQNVDAVKEIEKPKKVVSKIDGEFVGWNGKTKFVLKNGQIWQQRSSGKLKKNLLNPDVTITRNIMGFYKLKIDGTHHKIGVKRIK